MRVPPTLPGTVSTDPNLFDFFLGHVDRAVEDQAVPVSDEGVWYLTSLLVERAHPDPQDPEEATATLAELRLRAARADRPAAIRAWRSLGDRALVDSGFFRESLERKAVGRQYYLDMGAMAYDSLAALLRAAGFGRAVRGGEAGPRGLDAIYEELAAAFAACSEVLAQVRDAVRERAEGELSDQDLLALYEQWRATGNPRLAARLARAGFAVAGSGDGRLS